MTLDNAIDMAKSKLECMELETRGSCPCDDCDNCSLNYEQGNMGEQIEWLGMAIKALEREQKFLDAGYKNGRVEFMIGGRKFMVKEMAQ